MPYEAKGKCVYKKDGGAKVGCTTGDVNDYLAALHANVKTEQEQLKESFVALGRDKMFAAMVSVKDAIKNNAVNTSDAVKTIVKSIKTGEELTSEQKTKIGNDLRTLLKNLGYGAVFMLPGGSVFIITFNLIKKIMDKKKLKSLNESNKLKGGEGDKMTPKKIANKFDVDVKDVKKQIEYGTCVECEHSDDKEKAKEIATDHVSEFPDYYNRLDKMEKEAKKHWGTDKKKENKKETMNETKSLIKRLVRENMQQSSINQQIAQQIEKMGLDPNEVDINLNHAPLVYNAKPEQEIEEGARSYVNKILISCMVVAGAMGGVSCQKAKTKVMYKCSYKDSRIDSEGLNPNLRATSFYAYDHILSDAEIKAEEAKIEPETEKLLNIDIIDGTLKLEFEEVDTQGEWG